MKSINEFWKMVGLMALMTGLMMASIAGAQSPADGLVPSARVLYPNLSTTSAKVVPPTVNIGMLGTDPDASSGLPVKFRMLMVSAQFGTTPEGDPRYIRTPFEYDLYGRDLLTWDRPEWSEWADYPTDGSNPFITFPSMPVDEYFLFVVQVMDSDGAVSTDLDYQVDVFNFRVVAGSFAPAVTVCEPFLGCRSITAPMNEIASGQPLNFNWTADASAYGGIIVSYRHGWDLVDPNDPNDPGWAVLPGLEPENLFAVERSFSDGLHRFYLRVVDDSNQVRLIQWSLSVVPFVSRDMQLELLLLDQTLDKNSNRWPDSMGQAQDTDLARDAYWSFLADGSGGVSGFNWERDAIDDVETVSYSDLVKYKAVICYAKANSQQLMFQQFRPVNDEDRYVWLAPYQWRGGNYFQVGENSMESFLEAKPNYMIPIIFDANETTYVTEAGTYVIGFGSKELPDGSIVQRGPTMYPYANAGIAALDWTSPGTMTIFGREYSAKFDRKADCVGLKGLVLDPDFRAYHAVGAGAIADTFITDEVIDWVDAQAAAADTLKLISETFPFRTDEFVDANLSIRATPVIPQECLGIPEAPGGMCVEPMFTGIARMDWIRENKWDGGDPAWPQSEYSAYELEDGCGPLGMTSYQGTPNSGAVTNGKTFGYLSYKMVMDKPYNAADVYWGFDPYRFNHTETKKAVRWVLDYFGLNVNP